MTSYGFRVYGNAAPQGSKIPGANSTTGKLFVREQAGDKLKDWRKQIVVAAWAARGLDEKGNEIEGVTPIPTIAKEVACSVQIQFLVAKPKTTKRRYPSVQPDLDKLTRAVLDGLQAAGVFVNDGQVVKIWAIKSYSDDRNDEMLPGAWITVSDHLD